MEKENKNIETDKKLDKMRSDLQNSEKCKNFAKKLMEYIKKNR